MVAFVNIGALGRGGFWKGWVVVVGGGVVQKKVVAKGGVRCCGLKFVWLGRLVEGVALVRKGVQRGGELLLKRTAESRGELRGGLV